MTRSIPAMFISEPARETPVMETADVVIAGGGPGGIAAAVAAARRGADVLIIEHYGFLGGLATAGQIGPLFGYNTSRVNERLLGGFPLELLEELQALEGAPPMEQINWGSIPFEPEMFKHAAERLLSREPRIRFLLHTTVVGVIKESDRIDALLVESKSGRWAIRGNFFIDATGDGDVAWHAGCAFTKGRKADGATQSMGTKFRIGGVRSVTPEERQQSVEIFNQAIAERRVPAYHPFVREISESGATLRPDEETPTVTRARGDGTNVYDLTRNEMQLRADTLEIVDFCRKNIPGYERCYLMSTPAQIGVRETRQISGRHILTGDECLAGTKFTDGVAYGSWFLDIHCPLGWTSPLSGLCSKKCLMTPDCIMKKAHMEDLYEDLWLPTGTYYEIPYRSITPLGVENLLVSGRCISADHGAMSSLRVIGTCMAIGEAAGVSAALALAENIPTSTLDGARVRVALESSGALAYHIQR